MPIQYRFSPKYPDDESFFTYDFTTLMPPGITIASVDGVHVYYNVNGLAGAAADITQPSPPNLTGNKVTAFLAGGTLNTDYIVSYSIIRSDGEDDTRSAFLFVGQV